MSSNSSPTKKERKKKRNGSFDNSKNKPNIEVYAKLEHVVYLGFHGLNTDVDFIIISS
jgi:hypothetical protein